MKHSSVPVVGSPVADTGVTQKLRNLPLSAETGVYVVLVAPEIGVSSANQRNVLVPSWSLSASL
ncbi:hypothetical protein [Vibrio sp. B1REV9]|uniref:hypothetical protein n=1 Tax=Vibrio sp. B1REV9 TaxID=2751179 RepID=UPI001CC6DB16|nr:hypothetical protein [Vibrio sp. B1REV9]